MRRQDGTALASHIFYLILKVIMAIANEPLDKSREVPIPGFFYPNLKILR